MPPLCFAYGDGGGAAVGARAGYTLQHGIHMLVLECGEVKWSEVKWDVKEERGVGSSERGRYMKSDERAA